jgi:pre-mRNA-splicing factor CWC22
VNQYVIGSLVPLQILALLLDKPTDDGIEVAVNFIKECGQRLSKMSPKPFNGIFGVFRSILHEGTLDKRVQYMIEHLFIIRKSKYVCLFLFLPFLHSHSVVLPNTPLLSKRSI